MRFPLFPRIILAKVIIGAALLGITACKKDKKDDPTPATPALVFEPNAPFGPKSARLTGTASKKWRFRKFLINGVPQALLDPCLADFTLTFYTANRLYTGSFTQPTATCSGSTGNWNLAENETQLRLFPAGQSPVVWQFIEVSDTLLHYTTPAEVDGVRGSAELWLVPR